MLTYELRKTKHRKKKTYRELTNSEITSLQAICYMQVIHAEALCSCSLSLRKQMDLAPLTGREKMPSTYQQHLP